MFLILVSKISSRKNAVAPRLDIRPIFIDNMSPLLTSAKQTVFADPSVVCLADVD